jgi:hypothetical protein
MTDASSIANLTVLGADGGSVQVGTFWADQPAVLIWIRHYG